MSARMTRPQSMTLFGEMIWDAMEKRAQEQGSSYGYAQLARDIRERFNVKQSHAHLRNIVVGEKKLPRPLVIHRISAVLGLDEEAAMLAAGYATAEMQRLARQSAKPDNEQLTGTLMDDIGDLAHDAAALRERLARLISRGHEGGQPAKGDVTPR